jgi:uncharacterized protein YbaR (Trm112 family)
MHVVLQEGLLKILACPVDKDCLMYFADEGLLYNPRLRRAYRIEDGIPVMLAERAEPVPEPEHERLMTRAREGAATMSVSGVPPVGLSVSDAPVPDMVRPGIPGQ